MKVHIEFTEGEDKITLEGPTKDVQMAQGQIEAMVTDLVSVLNLQSHRNLSGYVCPWNWLLVKAQVGLSPPCGLTHGNANFKL